MKTTALVIATACAIAGSSTARADDLAQAEAHFRSAEAHFQSGNFKAAISGYSDSYKLFKAPILLFNIGLCHQKLGEKQQALDKYREYLTAEPNGAKAAEARTRADGLETVIAAEKAAAEQKRRATIAELKADIARLGDDHAARATAIAKLADLEPDVELLFDLGDAHQSAGDKAAAIAAYDRYLASEGASRAAEAKQRRDALDKQGNDNGGNGGNGNGGNGGGFIGGPQVDGDRPSIALPAVFTGVTVTTLSVAVLFGLRATGTSDDLEAELDEADPPLDSNDPRFDDGARDATIANVMFGVTLVSAGVAGYLWYRYLASSKSSRTAVAVAPGRSGINVGVQVRF